MRGRLLATVAVLALAFGLGSVLESTRRQVDLTAERSLSLSDESEAVVRAVRKPVRINAFLGPADPARAGAASLLERYHRLNRRITYAMRDPDVAGGDARRLGVDPALGGLALQSQGKVDVVASASEQDITASLARLIRGKAPTACVTTGHGEAALDARIGEGLSGTAEALRANGYVLRSVDLLVRPAVPEACDAVVVASPAVELSAGASGALARYLAGGGSALVLADPASRADLTPLLKPYGIGVERGIALEGDEDSRLGDDPLTLVVRRFSGPHPTVRRLAPLVMPGVQALTSRDDSAAGLASLPIASTTPLAYLERSPAEPRFEPGTDLAGPLAVAAAADRSSVERGRVVRTRVVVVGDVDFATNAWAGEGGNSRFVTQALDWLTLDEDLVSVSANLPSYRPLALTGGRLTYARLVTIGGIPMAFLLMGLLVWAVRRAR